MFGLLLAALALQGAAPPAGADAEIVVRGQRPSAERVRSFVESLTPTKMRGQIARYGQPVCPVVVGLSDRHNARVTARLRRVAKAAAVPVAPERCTGNLFVIVTDDRAALARQVRGALGDRLPVPPTASRADDLATLIHLEGLLDSNNQPVGIKEERGDGDSGYYQLEVFGSNRIRPVTSSTFLAAALIVEPAALDGLTTIQFADYAAMRLLARADPARLGPDAPPSILPALAAPAGTSLPLSLTDWDLGFLRSLYRSEGQAYSRSQRREISDRLRRELGGQPATAPRKPPATIPAPR